MTETEAYQMVEALLERARNAGYANGLTLKVWVTGLLGRAAIDCYEAGFASEAETRDVLRKVLEAACDGAEETMRRAPGVGRSR